jgi:hypothetical protein
MNLVIYRSSGLTLNIIVPDLDTLDVSDTFDACEIEWWVNMHHRGKAEDHYCDRGQPAEDLSMLSL